MKVIDSDKVAPLFRLLLMNNKNADAIIRDVQELVNLQSIDPVHAAGACYCRECKHCLIDLSDREYHICMRKSATRHRVSPTDFCSRGERKQNEILD